MNTNSIERARSYIARVPGAVSGAGGHNATFHAACVLVLGFGLTPAEALPLLLAWNTTCQPLWSEADLRHKLADADRANSAKPRGYLVGSGGVWTPRRHVARPGSASAQSKPANPLPDRAGFGPGTLGQVQRLADARPYHREGLAWAQERGVLVFGVWHGFECYGLTDASARVLEVRRIDGNLFPAVPGTAIRARKCHAVKGSQKPWSLGILEACDLPAVALLEGVPDFLTAHSVALSEGVSRDDRRDSRCAPVAMLSASPAIHPDALPHFKGKFVRIFPHSERMGLKGAAKWQAQLAAAGAACVDVFDFSPYRKADGSRVNDLWEFVHDLHPDDRKNPVTWRILP